MAKECLYCGLQFDDTAAFCPNCGRPTESSFIIRPLQEPEAERLRKELKEKDERLRHLISTRTQQDEASHAALVSNDRSERGEDNERGKRNGASLKDKLTL